MNLLNVNADGCRIITKNLGVEVAGRWERHFEGGGGQPATGTMTVRYMYVAAKTWVVDVCNSWDDRVSLLIF